MYLYHVDLPDLELYLKLAFNVAAQCDAFHTGSSIRHLLLLTGVVFWFSFPRYLLSLGADHEIENEIGRAHV